MDAEYDDIRVYLNASTGGTVTLEKNDETGVALLCLNRPEKKNAMTGQMMVQLRDHVITLEKWHEGKAVIFYGMGNFCSGGDLNFAKESGHKKGAIYMNKWMTDALTRLRKLPLISVCLISGATLGGGAEMASFSDFIIATDDVKFAYVQGKMGIVPAWGGTTSLIQRLGRQKALGLILSSRILTASECVETGLAEAIVSKSKALEETKEWLKSRIQHDRSVIRTIKEVSLETMSSFETAQELERTRFIPFWGCDNHIKAINKNVNHVK